MKDLPMQPLSPEEQQRLMSRMYVLLGRQVKSYHRQRNMGDHTSVPVELARELMKSMEYTIELAGGPAAGADVETVLEQGQKLLGSKLKEARSMLDLAAATAPGWQTECRWEAMRCLRRYLESYDHHHLAHREPYELFYPIPVSLPEGVRGIDVCLFYLHVLWVENQIMAGFEDGALERLWSRLPADTLNQCEQVLLNGLGKIMLHGNCEELVFEYEERKRLQSVLSCMTPGELGKAAEDAALCLCRKVGLGDRIFVCAAAGQMLPRLETAAKHDHLAAVFL